MSGVSCREMPWSRNTSWRQGSVLAQKDFQAVGLTDAPNADLAVAISHDCDIANDNLEAEPAVEFIFARILEQTERKLYAYGKIRRTLHLQYEHVGKTVFPWNWLPQERCNGASKLPLRQFSLIRPT